MTSGFREIFFVLEVIIDIMSHIIAVAMQKGGAGKTTTALNLGACLAQDGFRVLLVDLDPQANLTGGLGVTADSEEIEYSIYEVLLNPEQNPSEYAVLTTANGVDLIPATIDLAGAEHELANEIGRELRLREALEHLRSHYDFIILDPPPSLGIFTTNAFAAAESVIVPLETHPFAWKAMPRLEETIGKVRKIQPNLRIGGIVCTKVENTVLSRAIEERARAKYGNLVFKTVVRKNVRLAEAPAAGEPINIYAPDSPGAIAYRNLAKEVEERYA